MIASNKDNEHGFTLLEILTVCLIVGVIATMLVMPSVSAVKSRSLESNAILKLQRIATAEKRYYAEFGIFGTYRELVDSNFLPQGYSTRFFYNPLRWGESILPFIDKYSLNFIVPDTPNSSFFVIQAIPERSRLDLKTFNINMFLDGPTPDRIVSIPPVRKGLDENGEPVTIY